MMRKQTNHKHASQRKVARGRMKSRRQRAGLHGSSGEMGIYHPNRGEATN